MYAFQYQKPATLKQAREQANATGGNYLAGGQSLVQAMKLRMSSPGDRKSTRLNSSHT